MTHEYGDPLSAESIAEAVRRTIALRERRPGENLVAHVEQAIRECICACAVEIEDGIEHGRSGTHSMLTIEVRIEAERELARREKAHRQALVDIASNDSFPASDPPAWIWRGY